MQLRLCLSVAEDCDLETVGEAISNIKIHAGNLFSYDEIKSELIELMNEETHLYSTTDFTAQSSVKEVLNWFTEMDIAECPNQCRNYVSKNTCMYCKQNRIVSTNRYSAMRVTGIEKVIGYLVKDKKDGTIIGILNEDVYYAELACVDENTLEPVVEESCIGLCEIYKKQLQYVHEIVEDVIKNCASEAVMQHVRDYAFVTRCNKRLWRIQYGEAVAFVHLDDCGKPNGHVWWDNGGMGVEHDATYFGTLSDLSQVTGEKWLKASTHTAKYEGIAHYDLRYRKYRKEAYR